MAELVKRLNERQALVKDNNDYYLVSQSKTFTPVYDFKAPEPEVLVFHCNSDGIVANWMEVNGERGTTLEEYLPKLLQSNKVSLYD